jgi:hypothetical protein
MYSGGILVGEVRVMKSKVKVYGEWTSYTSIR